MSEEIDPQKQRTLRNWVMVEKVITGAQMKELIDAGHVPEKKVNATLVTYQQLQEWGVV